MGFEVRTQVTRLLKFTLSNVTVCNSHLMYRWQNCTSCFQIKCCHMWIIGGLLSLDEEGLQDCEATKRL